MLSYNSVSLVSITYASLEMVEFRDKGKIINKRFAQWRLFHF